MSNRATIELLISGLATSREQGWEWIVALHDGGFELRMGTSLPYFSDPNSTEFIQPGLTQGVVTWTASGSQYSGSSPTFPDPMAALVWWSIQKSNKGQADSGWDDGIPKAPQPAQMIQPPQQAWGPVPGSAGQPMSAPAQPQAPTAVDRARQKLFEQMTQAAVSPSIQPFLKDVPFT